MNKTKDLIILRKGLHEETKVVDGDWIVFTDNWLGKFDTYIIDENGIKYNVLDFCYIIDRIPNRDFIPHPIFTKEVYDALAFKNKKRSCLLLDKNIDIKTKIIDYGNTESDERYKKGTR